MASPNQRKLASATRTHLVSLGAAIVSLLTIAIVAAPYTLAQTVPSTPKAMAAPNASTASPAMQSAKAGNLTIPAPTPATPPSRIHQMSDQDFLDRAGLGSIADVAVMSILAMITGAVLAGALLVIFRAAFGSLKDARTKWVEAESAWLDLVKRKARGQAQVNALSSQIAALNKQLGR